MICRANQLTGFYMITTLALNVLRNLIVNYGKSINPFHATVLFPYPLETSED